MRGLQKILLPFFALVYATCLQAQDIHFHINKPLYVEEEVLHFKIYSGQILTSRNDVPALIGLYSPDGKELIGRPLTKNFRDGVLSGRFELENISSDGYYLLRAFLNDKVYTVRVPVYKKTLPEGFEYNVSAPLQMPRELTSARIDLDTDKSIYKAREPISLKIDPKNASEFLATFKHSISVFRYAGDAAKTLLRASEKPFPLQISAGITGNIKLADSGEPVHNSMVVAYFINSGTFTSSYTDDSGNISIRLDEAQKSDLMYLQAFSRDGLRLGEALFSPTGNFEIPILPETGILELVRSEAVNNYVHQSIQMGKMARMYGQATKTEGNQRRPQFEYDIAVEPDNFSQLASFRDVVRETLTYAKIKKDRSTKMENIYLKNTVDLIRYEHSPFYLINGKPLLDSQVILSLDVNSVQTVKMVSQPTSNRQFWQMGSYGVVAIELKQGAVNPMDSLGGLYVEVKGQSERTDLKSGAPREGPYFTNELYWSQNLYTDKDNSIILEYSDDDSPFVVDLVGIKEDGSIDFVRKVINRE